MEAAAAGSAVVSAGKSGDCPSFGDAEVEVVDEEGVLEDADESLTWRRRSTFLSKSGGVVGVRGGAGGFKGQDGEDEDRASRSVSRSDKLMEWNSWGGEVRGEPWLLLLSGGMVEDEVVEVADDLSGNRKTLAAAAAPAAPRSINSSGCCECNFTSWGGGDIFVPKLVLAVDDDDDDVFWRLPPSILIMWGLSSSSPLLSPPEPNRLLLPAAFDDDDTDDFLCQQPGLETGTTVADVTDERDKRGDDLSAPEEVTVVEDSESITPMLDLSLLASDAVAVVDLGTVADEALPVLWCRMGLRERPGDGDGWDIQPEVAVAAVSLEDDPWLRPKPEVSHEVEADLSLVAPSTDF